MSPDAPPGANSLEAHAVASSLRERIVEHVLVGDLLRRLWQMGIMDVEVLRSEFDAGGHDLVLSYGSIVRHVQLKSSLLSGSRRSVGLSVKLAARPSGCVVWVLVTPDLDLHTFLWLGGPPTEPLPDISAFKTLRHTKANTLGEKAERPNHRGVPRARFDVLSGLDDLIHRLFGPIGHEPPA